MTLVLQIGVLCALAIVVATEIRGLIRDFSNDNNPPQGGQQP